MKTVSAAFLEFCGPEVYARFINALQRRHMRAWQVEVWRSFTRATAAAVPDRRQSIATALSRCPHHGLTLLPGGQRRGLPGPTANAPLPSLCSVCRRVADWPARPPLALELIARWGITTYQRFVRVLARSVDVGRPMLRSHHERWLAFVRATPRSLPDTTAALLKALTPLPAEASAARCASDRPA